MIEVRNLTRYKIDKSFVRKIIRRTLREMTKKDTMSVEVAFVGKSRMQEINKTYRHKDEAADVLSFGTGEIIVCPASLKNRAKNIGVEFEGELAHILVHSTLHLLGWEHEGDGKTSDQMHKKEEKILSKIL